MILYRYYETFHVPVKYPFGYGLSYTSFSYSELNVPEVYSGGKIQIRFKIKNIGKVSGAEIAQLYICPIESDVIRSHIELKGFQKIYLHPGEEKEVILELDERSFSVYDVEKKAFSMLSGKYQICIGASVHDLQLKANMEVVGNSYFRNERELFPDYFREQPHGMEISAEQFYQLLGGEPKHDKEKKRGEYTVYDSYQDVVNVSMFGKFVRGVVHIGLKIMLRGKSERDPAFKMVKMGVEEGNLEGLIATSGGIATPKLIDMLVYNANKKYLQALKRLLSALFHKETGQTLTVFIHKVLIEKAQNLLAHSDYSLGEISTYLNFSSQSYFISIFKRYTGITPGQYRKMHCQISW